MKVSSNQNFNTNFKAQLLAQWRCLNSTNKPRNISIASLEKIDLEFIKEFRKKLNIYEHLTPAQQAIIDFSTKTIETILESIIDKYKKIKMYIAIYNGKPCGILIGNIPKKIPTTENITYSSRHNAARNETEVDWLVTWNPNKNEKIKGIGKSLVCEFFRTLKNDNFRDVFVRSEVPEFSYAASFYESLGFERLGKKRIPLLNKNTSPYVIADSSDSSEQVIPMIITKGEINKLLKKIDNEIPRQEFVKSTIDIHDLINLKHLQP